MILDDKNSLSRIEDISNQVLAEICNGDKSYPKIFIEKATTELSNRGIDTKLTQKKVIEYNDTLHYKKWIQRNLFLIVLIIFTALSAGIIGFFVVISSVAISINPRSRQDRIRRWNYLNILLIFINAILILITFQLMR